MKIPINFEFEYKIDNIINVLEDFLSDEVVELYSENNFIKLIYNDLYDNYFWTFYENENGSSDDDLIILEWLKKIIPENLIKSLYNLYLENRKYINNKLLERVNLRKMNIALLESRNKRYLHILEERYNVDNYIPPKNAISVIYKGKEYKSKAQCCYLEGITKNQLNKYLYENKINEKRN